jgi:ABC-type amino acid transport substrate-binding protein
VLLLAHVLWLIERRRDDAFAKPYLRAIGEGMWLTLLIIATGEHGERSIPGVVRRVAIVGLWLVGVVLTAHLTATVTSSQTAQRLQSSVNGPADLPGKAIATVPGSTAAEYLTQRALDFVPIQHTTEGIRMLTAGEVQAVVFDAPTLQYWASRQGGGVQVVGSIFRPEKYGIAVANGSPLRKRINEALLAMFADGAYERLYANWFTRAR